MTKFAAWNHWENFPSICTSAKNRLQNSQDCQIYRKILKYSLHKRRGLDVVFLLDDKTIKFHDLKIVFRLLSKGKQTWIYGEILDGERSNFSFVVEYEFKKDKSSNWRQQECNWRNSWRRLENILGSNYKYNFSTPSSWTFVCVEQKINYGKAQWMCLQCKFSRNKLMVPIRNKLITLLKKWETNNHSSMHCQ